MRRPVSIAVTICIAFFLTFFGMRIYLPDPTVKPKPRPRAVLKIFPKSPASEAKIEKQKHCESCTVTAPGMVAPVIVAGELLPLPPRSACTPAVASPPAARSPPRC